LIIGGEPEVFFGKSEFWEPFMAQSQENIVTFAIAIGQRMFLHIYVAIGLK
jgi:hypothetical protein